MTEEVMQAGPATAELCLLPRHLRKPRLNRREASEYLLLAHGIKRAPGTLAKLASIGGGPAYQVANRSPLYPTIELDRWAADLIGPVIASSSAHKENQA